MHAEDRWLEENKAVIQEYDVQVIDCYQENRRDLYYQVTVEFPDGQAMHLKSAHEQSDNVKLYSISCDGDTIYDFTEQGLYSETHSMSEVFFLLISVLLAVGPFAFYSYLRITYGYEMNFSRKTNKFI